MDDPATKTFSCAPTQTLIIGRFEFNKGVLTLSGDDLAEFEAALAWFEKNQPVFRRQIKTLDLDAANAIGAQFLASAVQGPVGVSVAQAGMALAAAIATTPTPMQEPSGQAPADASVDSASATAPAPAPAPAAVKKA